MTYQTPAGPKPPIPRFWRTAAIGFFILMLLFGGISAAAFSGLATISHDNENLRSQVANLNSQLAKDNQTIAADNTQIASLQAQVTTLNGQISTLQAQASTDAATIASLQAKVTSLNMQIVSLNAQIAKSNVLGTFTWDSTCNSIFGCNGGLLSGNFINTVDSVAIANTGTDSAFSVTLTVTFYNGNNPICSTAPIFLGKLSGQSIQGFVNPSGGNCNSRFTPITAAFITSLTWS